MVGKIAFPFSVFRAMSEPLMPHKRVHAQFSFLLAFVTPSSQWVGKGGYDAIQPHLLLFDCSALRSPSPVCKKRLLPPAEIHTILSSCRHPFSFHFLRRTHDSRAGKEMPPTDPVSTFWDGIALRSSFTFRENATPPHPCLYLNVNQSPVCTSLFNHFPSGGQDANPPPFGCFPLPALGHRSRTERGQSSKFFPLVFDFKWHYFQGSRRVFSFPPLVVSKVCSARRSRKNSDSSLSLCRTIIIRQ